MLHFFVSVSVAYVSTLPRNKYLFDIFNSDKYF